MRTHPVHGPMYGVSRNELRFAIVISSVHFSEHFLKRLLPPLIPILAVALEYPLWQLGLLLTIYSIGSGIAQAPLGVISDRYDRSYILPTGVSLVGLAYALFAFAPTIGAALPTVAFFDHSYEGGFLIMCIAMAIGGIGSAVVHPTTYPMITDNTSDSNKGKVLGIFGASSKLGDAAAPATVAVLIFFMQWQQILLVLGFIGVVYGVLLFILLQGGEYETVPSGNRTDSDNEQTEKEQTAVSDRRTYVYPMVVIYLFFVSKMLTTRGINTFLPAFIVAVYAYSFDIGNLTVGTESAANVYFALLLVAGAVTQLILGALSDNYDSRTILLSCMAVATAGLIALAVLDLNPLFLLLVILVLGTGLYGINPVRDSLISQITPPEREGRTFGYIWTAAILTGAALPTIIGYILDVVGMREGFLILAAGTILASGAIALLYSDRVYVDQPETVSRSETAD